MPSNQASFTIKSVGRLREIHTDIGIRPAGEALTTESIEIDDTVMQTRALWDTGATNCVVTEGTARALGLVPISRVEVAHAGGITLQNVYLVDLFMPNRLVLQGIGVTECVDSAGNFGVIIGMDIITMGDFSISNLNGGTTVSFRMPSQEEVDFTKPAAPAPTVARRGGSAYTPPKKKRKK